MFGLAFRALLLDGSVYQEIKEREETMFAALGIVTIAAVAFALGVWSVIRESGSEGFDPQENLVLFVAISVVLTGWFVWAAFVWLLGIRLFQGSRGYRAALRSIGICYAPLTVSILAGWQPMLVVVGALWIMFAGVVAIRNTLELAWWKATIASLFGWLWGMLVVPGFLLSPYLAN